MATMPIYEYRCPSCRRRVGLFQRRMEPPADPACPHCGAPGLLRLFSSFALLHSEEARLTSMAEEAEAAALGDGDAGRMASWARRMGQEMGEDLGPEFEEMVGRMGEGEMPEEGVEGEDWE